MTEVGADNAGQRRADARRNRDKIFAAAQEAFAEPDADVSMAEIARRAGIGSATLYRNFPDRRSLLESLYSEEISAICEAATAVPGATPLARLQEWLRRFYAYFTGKRVLAAELLEQVDSDHPVFGTGYTRILDAASGLVDEARRSGELRHDLSAEQILALVASVANIPGDAAYRAPVLDAALDALAARP